MHTYDTAMLAVFRNFIEAFRDESDPEGLSHSRAAGSERYTRDVPRPSRVSVRLKREH